MKRLTMNQVARASLKANKKAYRSLMITVFLTVYLVTVASLCCYGTWLARQEKPEETAGVPREKKQKEKPKPQEAQGQTADALWQAMRKKKRM